MLSSLGITHHVSPTSILFFWGKNTLNWLAEKDEEGTAGLFQDRSPLRELWETWKRWRKVILESTSIRNSQQFHSGFNSRLLAPFEWAAFTKSWVRQSDNVQAHLSTITASTCYNLAPSGIFCAVILIKAVLCRRCRAAMRKRTINQQHKGSTQSLVLSYSKETIFAFCHGVKQERLHFGFQG